MLCHLLILTTYEQLSIPQTSTWNSLAAFWYGTWYLLSCIFDIYIKFFPLVLNFKLLWPHKAPSKGPGRY